MTVEEVDLGWPKNALEMGMAYLNHLFGASLARLLEEHADELCTYTRKFAEDGQASKATEFVATLDTAAQMYSTLGPLLEDYDVFICPTNALAAVPADHDQSKDEVKINGKVVNPSLGWVMTTPFNMLSRCPVISVPTGHAKNRVPTGIQIVGRTYCDEDVIRAALAYEKAVGGWYGAPADRPKI